MSSQNDDADTRGVLIFLGFIVAVVVVGVIAFALLGMGPKKAGPETMAAESAAIEEVDIAPVGEAMVKVYYESGQASLTPEAQAELATVVAAATAQPGMIVLVSGFHDASGDAALNAELAKQRALGVREYLLSAGLVAERVKLRKPESTLGNGQAAEARRVELRVQ